MIKAMGMIKISYLDLNKRILVQIAKSCSRCKNSKY